MSLENRTWRTSSSVLGTSSNRTQTKRFPLKELKSFETVALLVGFPVGNPPKISTWISTWNRAHTHTHTQNRQNGYLLRVASHLEDSSVFTRPQVAWVEAAQRTRQPDTLCFASHIMKGLVASEDLPQRLPRQALVGRDAYNSFRNHYI